jgi:SAM-dependent methyltransferase
MQNEAKIQNWFETWFNSPYYHILYKNRDNKEAQLFLTNLLAELNPPKKATILDLACGKGRHAIFLHKLGYDVTGTDLSESSIQWARQFEEGGLKFLVKDMRNPIENVKFNCIFNLFTSFGYFDNSKDNIKVLRAAHQMLEPNGCLVIDFLNVHYVKKHFVSEEVIKRNGITFHIHRKFKADQIQKQIRFTDKNIIYEFTEYVQALELDDFKDLLDQTDMYIYKAFGNYKMDAYDPDNADRLILICKKRI